MILEVAILSIKTGQSAALEKAFSLLDPIIASMKDYMSHQLKKCIEKVDRYPAFSKMENAGRP